MTFANVEQIREKFIKDGWSDNISFEELAFKDAEEKGYSFVLDDIAKGEKYFIMNNNGNVYNNKGKIVFFNILPQKG